MPSRSVAELCDHFATLDSARIALDEQIQRRSGGMIPEDEPVTDVDDPDSDVPEPTGSAEPTPAGCVRGPDQQGASSSYSLWMELASILAQQDALINELADIDVINTVELRQKASILESLLQGANTRGDLTQNLTGSVVRDIKRLFA